MNKVTACIIALLLLVFGGIAVWSFMNPDKMNFDNYDSTKIIKASEDNGNIGDHVRGNEESKIVLVEYADLQCPGCASMMPKISKLYEQYGDRIAFVYRNYPLQGHQNARAAAAAVEAAAKQGYYWQMIESLYDNRNDWINIFDTEKRTNVFASNFMTVSKGAGDESKFRSDLNDQNIQKKIDFDKKLGSKKDSVSETPSFYIDGEKIDLNQEGREFDAIIAEKINEKLKAAGLETGPKGESESSTDSTVTE